MKISPYKIYILCFMLLSDFMMFAQLPSEDEDGELQDNDEPAVSINRKLIWLAIAGVVFAYYYFKKQRKTQAQLDK